MTPTDKTRTVDDPDWLGFCRRSVEKIESVIEKLPHTVDRNREIGTGAGGDRTLQIDMEAEDAVFDELERIASDGHSFTAISEERGEVRFGDGAGETVVIDPIDGSLNAKRTIPYFTLSIAVAKGMTMEDVKFGYIYNFGAGEEFFARSGEGAWLDGKLLKPLRTENQEILEIVAIEGTDPCQTAKLAGELQGMVYRFRGFGSIALSLAYVAAGRCDGLVTMRPCRSVDSAAGQLIAREAGASVEVIATDSDQVPGLDLKSRYICIAACSDSWHRKLKQASDAG